MALVVRGQHQPEASARTVLADASGWSRKNRHGDSVVLNVQTIRSQQHVQLATSSALLVLGLAGVLAGQGHTLTPTAVAVLTAALLAWKESLANFSLGLTDTELLGDQTTSHHGR